MARVIVLDEGPLWLACKGKERTPDAEKCRAWLAELVAYGAVVIVPEIADYEVRRELVRSGSHAGIRRLNAIKSHKRFLYAPITTAAMMQAAELWAQARNQGGSSAAPEALDADVILAAQAKVAAGPADRLTIATGNVSHLSRFDLDARPWADIHYSETWL